MEARTRTGGASAREAEAAVPLSPPAFAVGRFQRPDCAAPSGGWCADVRRRASIIAERQVFVGV